jgi:hypothetical protein
MLRRRYICKHCVPKMKKLVALVSYCYHVKMNLKKGNEERERERSKVVPVTRRGGPYGCETSRLPHFV